MSDNTDQSVCINVQNLPDLEDGQAQYDELPPEAVDHLIAAFTHNAGFGPHPGQYNGPEVKNPNVPDLADFES